MSIVHVACYRFTICERSLHLCARTPVAGRFVALYDVKADDEARVHTKSNYFLRFPPASEARLTEFTSGVDQCMKPNDDIVCILEGRKNPSNKDVIRKVIKERKWSLRELYLHSDEKQVDALVFSGRGSKGARKCAKRGFASGAYVVVCHVCLKGKKVPRIISAESRYISPGHPVRSNMLPEVPVVARPDLPTAPAAVKEAILHGSIWDGKGDSDDDDEDGDESAQGDAVEDKGTVSRKMDATAYRTPCPKREEPCSEPRPTVKSSSFTTQRILTLSRSCATDSRLHGL